MLKSNGLKSFNVPVGERAPIIYLGDSKRNSQNIELSPYWSNVYGVDSTDGRMEEIIQNTSQEDSEILSICSSFINNILSQNLDIEKLNVYIHPEVYADRMTFESLRKTINSIENIGVSSKIRYNQTCDTAYVRILPNVRDGFIINTPHIVGDIYQISLKKYNNKWLIYSC